MVAARSSWILWCLVLCGSSAPREAWHAEDHCLGDSAAHCHYGPTVLYVTIGRARDVGHQPSIAELEKMLAPLHLRLEQVFIGDIAGKMQKELERRKPLAMIWSGSRAEWHEARDDDRWMSVLDEAGEVLRTTNVPILAICGSHQLVARSYGGWESIRHVGGATIAEEMKLEEGNLIPERPQGEQGTFPVTAVAGSENDPLLAGLPDHFWVTESHSDEVVYTGAIAAHFDPIVRPSMAGKPITPRSFEAPLRTELQGMRLRSTTRVLYAVTFHPELFRHPDLWWGYEWVRPTHGRRLTTNFLEIAHQHWQKHR
jgi:GMP synthase-like glutamine amidotransferase